MLLLIPNVGQSDKLFGVPTDETIRCYAQIAVKLS